MGYLQQISSLTANHQDLQKILHLVNGPTVESNTFSKESSWTLKKVKFSQKCFILGKLKAYYVKQVNVLFILIPNLKELVDK